DWAVASTPGSLQFSTASNPLKWNMIFNFWFDSPAAPGAGSTSMAQFLPGPGAASISVPTTVPTSLAFTNYGVGTPGCSGAEHLCANSPPQINNAAFAFARGGVGAPGCWGAERLCANSPPQINKAAFAFTCDTAPPSSLGLGLL